MTHSDAFQFLRDAFEASGVNGYELDFEDNIIRFCGVKFKAGLVRHTDLIRIRVGDASFYRSEERSLIHFIQNVRRD